MDNFLPSYYIVANSGFYVKRWALKNPLFLGGFSYSPFYLVFKTLLIGNNQNILEDYLKELGCHKVYHGKGKKYTLFEHLNDVKTILKRHNHPEYLQNAGLFHSVYGTTYFKPKMTEDREAVRSLIGDKAENLVYLFCNMKHPRKKNIELIQDDEVREDLLKIERATFHD